MLNQFMPPDSEGSMGHGHSNEEDSEELHMRQATSLLRLLRTSQDPSIESGDLKREFLQLTALLRKIDKLANEELAESEDAASELTQITKPEESSMPAPKRELIETPDDNESASPDEFEASTLNDEESVEPVASDWWDDRREDSAVEEPNHGIAAEPSSSFDEGGVDEDFGEEVTPFEAPGAAEAAQSSAESEEGSNAQRVTHSVEDDINENLRRWWVTFSGDVSLDRLARLRTRLNESPFTLETRFEELGDGMIVLRVVTDDRVSMQQVDWLLKELMDTVGLDKDSAILTPQ